MKLLGQLIRTAVNVAMLPVAVAKDVATLGGVLVERDESFSETALQRLKDEASEEADPDDDSD